MHSPAHLTFDERAAEGAGTQARPSEHRRSSEPDFSLNRLYYSSDATRPRLRIGVMINRGNAAQLFMRKVLEDICNSDFARLECVIENCEPPVNPRPVQRRSLASRVAKHLLNSASRQRVLYYRYARLLDAPRRLAPDPYSAADCSDLFEGVPRVEVAPLPTE